MAICARATFFSAELWVLLFWEMENSVSVHGGYSEELNTQLPAAVGNTCEVAIKGIKYTGKIAAKGW